MTDALRCALGLADDAQRWFLAGVVCGLNRWRLYDVVQLCAGLCVRRLLEPGGQCFVADVLLRAAATDAGENSGVSRRSGVVAANGCCQQSGSDSCLGRLYVVAERGHGNSAACDESDDCCNAGGDSGAGRVDGGSGAGDSATMTRKI